MQPVQDLLRQRWAGVCCIPCVAQFGALHSARRCIMLSLLAQVDIATCTCRCPPGYFGKNCYEYILWEWHAVDVKSYSSTVMLAWNLSSIEQNTQYVRYVLPLGSDSNVVIGGQQQPIDSKSGSRVFTLPLLLHVPNYPRRFFYAFHLGLGTTSFGTDKGFKIVGVPEAWFDETALCVNGGHYPRNAAKLPLCQGTPLARWLVNWYAGTDGSAHLISAQRRVPTDTKGMRMALWMYPRTVSVGFCCVDGAFVRHS